MKNIFNLSILVLSLILYLVGCGGPSPSTSSTNTPPIPNGIEKSEIVPKVGEKYKIKNAKDKTYFLITEADAYWVTFIRHDPDTDTSETIRTPAAHRTVELFKYYELVK